MIIGFSRRAVLATTFLALSGLAAAGCQRVPLLAPSGSTITLTAAATALPFNGTTDVIAQVIEPAGTPPHAGTHISFTTSLGRVDPSEAETDINGRAAVKFIAGGASGTATIMAASGGATVGASGALKIAVGAAAVGSVAISANPTTVSVAGGTSTVTASVFDSSGNPLTGIPVTFTTDAGGVSPTIATTDADGRAQTTLTTTRTAKVSASAGIGSVSGTTTTAAPSASVTVSVNTTQAITIGAVTPSSPTVGQTVTFPLTYATTSGATPVTRITVNWGDGRVESFSGQQGAISHSYSAAGSYVVQVTGTDATGDTSTTSASVTVGPRPLPTVSIALSGTTQPTAGTVTIFNLTATEPTTSTATITDVTVNFGDGTGMVDLGATSGTNIPIQHVYQSAGTFRVTAIATDSNGASNSASSIVVVQARQPLGVSITSSTPTVTGGTAVVTFTASVTPTTGVTAARYDWNFGDGLSSTTTSNVTTHSYSTGTGPRTVNVTVTSTDGQTATGTTVVVP